MAKKKKVEKVEEIVDKKEEQAVEVAAVEEPVKPEQEEKVDDGIAKLDLRDFQEKTIEEPVAEVEEKTEEQAVEEIVEEQPTEETPIEEIALEEVTEIADKLEENIEEAVEKAEEEGTQLPENIQKVIDFMDETGGSLEDYVQLNKDYSKMSDNDLLSEYLKQTKPHLNDEERSFLMEDLYSWDEDIDEDRDIKRKKLALKEQVADAKNHLDGLKSKYYDEIKAGSKLNPEQKKAIDFFNRYNENQTAAEDNTKFFKRKTNEVFSDGFKGFEYNVGDKRFRLNVKDTDSVKENQMDIGNFVNKFINKETNKMEDAKGYHKSLFTAMNPDVVANHFYQQGKADALKESMSKAKNVDMSPRGSLSGESTPSGTKFKSISGESSSDFKIKIGQNRSNRIT
tara:strand:- start:2454 stop:3644 length:1191 start_codon:yes stop_codon:yes gene_type:complete